MPSEILLSHPIAMPPSEVQGHLAGVFTNMNDRIAATRNETRNLAEPRDQLLPRLLSGELPVTAAKRVIEATA